MALDLLDSEGMSLPKKPKLELPELPEDLTALDDPDLMTLFRHLTVWTDYVNGRLAVAATEAETRLKLLRRVEAVRITASDAKTVKMAEAEARLDLSVREAQDLYDRADAFRRMLRVMMENLERHSSLVSRELTRRVNRSSVESRDQRWGGG